MKINFKAEVWSQKIRPLGLESLQVTGGDLVSPIK